jgi:hypothetical protein
VLTGVLALGAIGVLLRTVAGTSSFAPRHATSQWRRVIFDRQLLRLNYGIFALHAALMALFVQVPFMLRTMASRRATIGSSIFPCSSVRSR